MPISSFSPLTAADYDAIEAAVMETNRGRWFLSEFSHRNRHADTLMLLTAMERLENVVRGESATSVDRLRAGLIDMAGVIARAKTDIAALKPQGQPGRIEEATEELDSVVGATETATSEILNAAEQIQEIAWTLREQDLDAQHCDALDARATDIYTACSFQDITGQRTRKVIQAMRYLESRIGAMIDLWGKVEASALGSAAADPEGALLNGPAKPGHGPEQVEVDRVMHAAPALQPELTEEDDFSAPATIPAEPVTALAALSAEEKIALFS